MSDSWNLMNRSFLDSSVHGISQAPMLEWVAIPFPRGSSQTRDWTHVSCIAGGSFTTELPGKPYILIYIYIFPLLSQSHSLIVLNKIV